MMRDKRKSADYFKSYIEYQADRIKKKSDKLSASIGDRAKTARINQSLIRFKADMLYAQFSRGAGRDDLIKYLEDTLETASVLDSLDYETLLNLLSISVMLDEKEDVFALIDKHDEIIHKDKLLNFLATYIEKGTISWDGILTIKGLYNSLNNIATSDNKEEILSSYLSGWYDNHRDFSWYDSDKSDKDTYVGYWSFESAAIASIWKIDDKKLSSNQFYPKL